MKTFTNKKGISYLLLDVPEHAYNFDIEDGSLFFEAKFLGISTRFMRHIPKGNYELIGLDKNVSESQSEEIVDTTLMHDKHKITSYKFKSYIDGFMGFETASESLSSLVQSLGLNNPVILKLIK